MNSSSIWDKRYLKMAELVASWSKDPKAHVGAVIVRDNRVVATGFNGFPSGVLDDDRLQDQETKLAMTVHAEVNALVSAGDRAQGATIYVWGKPVCSRCASSIIQAGLMRVVEIRASTQTTKPSKWDQSGELAKKMFSETGIQCHQISLAEAAANDESEASIQELSLIHI